MGWEGRKLNEERLSSFGRVQVTEKTIVLDRRTFMTIAREDLNQTEAVEVADAFGN